MYHIRCKIQIQCFWVTAQKQYQCFHKRDYVIVVVQATKSLELAVLL